MSGADDVGVLFWLSSVGSSEVVPSIIPQLANVRLEQSPSVGTTYVVDNDQASFLFDTISTARSRFGMSAPQFFYCHTGQNYDASNRMSYGPILPVEYITSPILLLVFEPQPGQKTFVVSSRDAFSADRVRRLLGLARDVTQGLNARTEILFPDYNELTHRNAVQEAMSSFSDGASIVNTAIGTFRGDYRNTPNHMACIEFLNQSL